MRCFYDHWSHAAGMSQSDSSYVDAILNESYRKKMARTPFRLLYFFQVMSMHRRVLVRTADLYRMMLKLEEGVETAGREAEMFSRVGLPENNAEKLNPEDKIRILSFVAFRMCADGLTRLTHAELCEILREMMEKRADLIPEDWPDDTFLNLCLRFIGQDRRIQAAENYRPEHETGEKTYRFLYDAFREYLAAFAIIEGCTPEYISDPAALLARYLNELNFSMTEVIVLAAEMNIPCGHSVARQIVQMLSSTEEYPKVKKKSIKRALCRLLLRLLTEEVPLFDQEAADAFRWMYRHPLLLDDVEGIVPLSNGRYGKFLMSRLEELGRDFYYDSAYWTPLLEILRNRELNPFQYYLDRSGKNSVERERGLSMLSCMLWLVRANEKYTWELDAHISNLQEDLLDASETDDAGLQWQALRAIGCLFLIENKDKNCIAENVFTEKTFVRYLTAVVRYMNRMADAARSGKAVPPAKKIPLLEFYTMAQKTQMLFENPVSSAFLSASEKVHFEKETAEDLYAFFESITQIEEISRNYRDLFSVTLLAFIFHADTDAVSNLHQLIETWRQTNLKVNPQYHGINRLYNTFKGTLRKTVLSSEAYSETERQVAYDCIDTMEKRLAE